MQMRIKKRPSISKVNKEKQMNMTVSTALFPISQKQIKQLPPIKRNLRKPLQKIEISQKTFHKKLQKKQEIKQRKQTQTTLNQSMQQSYFFTTLSKGWIKPSDYLKEIEQLNLESSQRNVQFSDFQIKLNDKVEKNVKKISALFQLTEKWVDILKKANCYINSKKTNSQKLSEQVKFWRLLSKKFDQLQYEFNNQKTTKIFSLMRNSLKTNPQYRKSFEQFQRLKQSVIQNCIKVKKLYLTLQQVLSGVIVKMEQSSCIKQSIELLKRIIFCFNNLGESNDLLQSRLDIIYKKCNICLVQKLIAAPIYPKQLANVSGLKFRYEIIDSAMSFSSNFISILQEDEQRFKETTVQAQYIRNIISNLMEILCYFQYLYKKKQVLQFSKLFSFQIDFNIFDVQNQKDWEQYMNLVRQSMEKRNYET